MVTPQQSQPNKNQQKEKETNYGSWFAVFVILFILLFITYKVSSLLPLLQPQPAELKEIGEFIIEDLPSEDKQKANTVERVLYEGGELNDAEIEELLKKILQPENKK